MKKKVLVVWSTLIYKTRLKWKSRGICIQTPHTQISEYWKRQWIIIFTHSLGLKETIGLQTDLIGETSTLFKILEQNKLGCVYYRAKERLWWTLLRFILALRIMIFLISEFSERQKTPPKPNISHATGHGFLIATRRI